MRHRSGMCPAPRHRARLRIFALTLVAALLAGAAPAWAQDDTEGMFRKNGLYLAALGSYMIPTEKGDLKNDVDGALGGTGTDVDNSFGYNLRLGYRLHPRFSVESQIEFVNAIEFDTDLPAPGTDKNSEIKLFVLTGNAKAYLLTDRFQPYLVAGAGWSRSRLDLPGSGPRSTGDAFAMRIGAGADLYGSEYVALTGEVSYVTSTGSNENLDYLTIGAGLMLRFYMPKY